MMVYVVGWAVVKFNAWAYAGQALAKSSAGLGRPDFEDAVAASLNAAFCCAVLARRYGGRCRDAFGRASPFELVDQPCTACHPMLGRSGGGFNQPVEGVCHD